MFRLAQALKSRRESRRHRQVLDHAIRDAVTPGMRSELIIVGQRTDLIR